MYGGCGKSCSGTEAKADHRAEDETEYGRQQQAATVKRATATNKTEASKTVLTIHI